MGRENGEGSRSTPRVLTLEEARKRTLAAGGGKVEEEGEGQFQSFLHQYHCHNLQQQQQPPPPAAPKKQKTARPAAGRIVAVPGGHIVRSTGSKDRHSKVCTSKGLRDRRVRLSAHTAIEFYDVQDRLGYDRPSMAVDWLLKSARAAIDGLDELPPWQPAADGTAATAGGFQEVPLTADQPVMNSMNSYSDAGIPVESFPMVVSSSYQPGLLSQASSHVQDLRLSLDSGPNLFSVDATAETTARGSSGIGGGGGYLFNLPAPQQQQPMVIGPRFFTRGGPLQSSSPPPAVPCWMDQIAPAASSHGSMHPPAALFHRSWSSFPNIEFGGGGGGGGFSGFLMPSAWIQGREHVDDDGVSDKPPASH